MVLVNAIAGTASYPLRHMTKETGKNFDAFTHLQQKQKPRFSKISPMATSPHTAGAQVAPKQGMAAAAARQGQQNTEGEVGKEAQEAHAVKKWFSRGTFIAHIRSPPAAAF